MARLDLLNVGLVEETGGILVVLRAPEMARLLVIETGPLEGQAIALEAGGVRAERPLTQDLLFDVISRLGAKVKEVHIGDFRDETFFARVVLMDRPDGGETVELDARPSDAIALALRAGAPMYVNDRVMVEMGIPEDRNGRFAELFDDDEDGERVIH
jgi:bifunctional DNase/RNase